MTPTPIRQRLQNLLTPKVADRAIVMMEDLTRKDFPEIGTPHPDTQKYPNHKFAGASKAKDDGTMYTFIYLAPREDQDDYNWEFTKADIGGTKFDAIQRTYITPRSEFVFGTPAMGAANPLVPVAQIPAGHILAIRQQSRSGDQEIDALFVVDVHTYVKKTTIRRIGVDPFNGQELYSETTLYYATEVVEDTALTAAALFLAPSNTYWGLQSDGTQREGEQLSTEWYAVTTSAVIGGVLADGILTVRSYTTSVNFSWPPVLRSVNPVDNMDWELKDGASRYYPTPFFSREGYSGPCEATITETWSKTAFTIDAPEVMKPTPISYNCPFFSLRIGACLHGSVNISADTGSADPTWGVNVGSLRNFPATTPTDWPATITLDEQRPFRGGYLRQVVVINKPFA